VPTAPYRSTILHQFVTPCLQRSFPHMETGIITLPHEVRPVSVGSRNPSSSSSRDDVMVLNDESERNSSFLRG
jgi:hypothetical protein